MIESHWGPKVTPIRIDIQISDGTADVDDFEILHHADPMTEQTEYRHELHLRDEQLRREIDQRQESFRAEQAIRDKAADDRFQSFLTVQAERDKRLDESVAGIRGELSKLGSLKLSVWGAMFTGLAITLAVIAFGVTTYQAGQADRRPIEQSAPASPAAQSPSK